MPFAWVGFRVDCTRQKEKTGVLYLITSSPLNFEQKGCLLGNLVGIRFLSVVSSEACPFLSSLYVPRCARQTAGIFLYGLCAIFLSFFFSIDLHPPIPDPTCILFLRIFCPGPRRGETTPPELPRTGWHRCTGTPHRPRKAGTVQEAPSAVASNHALYLCSWRLGLVVVKGLRMRFSLRGTRLRCYGLRQLAFCTRKTEGGIARGGTQGTQ